jgi:hypothetical protein
MSSSDDLPYPLTFHAFAAARGDGLHPLLAEALAKTGSVSGPPPVSEQNQENVVRPDFGKTNRANRGKRAKGTSSG